MFMLGMNGSNFSRKEKDKILEVVKDYEWNASDVMISEKRL